MARFALLSALPVLALGVVLSLTVRQLVLDRYLDTYARSTDITVNSMASLLNAEPVLEQTFLTNGPSVLKTMVSANRVTASLTDLKAYTSDGKLAFSAAEGSGREIEPVSVRQAFASGRTMARFIASAPAEVRLKGRAIELAVPIRQGSTIPAVVHAYDSAADLDQAVASGVRRADLVLAGGLAVLWLVLFPVVLSASRRLRRQAAENERLALHDSLTGLANRNLFADRMVQAIAAAERSGEKVGLLLLDLDRFKEVNDCLGHQHGDDLLREVAGVLDGRLREDDTIARLGGDEFGIILPDISSEDDALEVAHRLLAALEEPTVVNGVAVTPQASVGVSLWPDHGATVEGLLGKADIAMYAAKASRDGVTVYHSDRDFSMPARLGLVTELRAALGSEEIICHYQPLVRIPDGQIRGVEALVRWQHPERGLLAPGEFLPIVEQAGLTQSLTRRVLKLALEQCARWRAEGLDLVVSVNLSPRSLRDTGLPAMVFTALDDAGVPPTALELEITEDALLDDPKQAKVLLDALTGQGVRISLDDFGTGYSSLAYLSQLPVSKVKIDRAFLTDLINDRINERIVASVIDLGERLGMEVLAEGVETAEVWDRLQSLGCAQAQGYYMSRPLPAEDVPAWACAHGATMTAPGPLPALPPALVSG